MGQHHVAVKFQSIEIKSSMMARRFCSPLLLIWSQASPRFSFHMSHLISPSKLTGGKKLILWLFWLKVFLEEQKSNFANSSMPGFLTDRFSAVITSFRGSVKPFTTVTVSLLSSWSWIYLKRQNVQISPRRRWRGARVWPASEQFLCGS